MAKSSGIHVPRLPLGVDEHRLRAAVDDRVGRSGEGQALAEHRIAALHAREDHRQMQRRRAGRQSDRIALAHVGTHRFFKFVNILAQRRDPVLPKCVVNVLQFIALTRHMRAGQQKSFIHLPLLCFLSNGCQSMLLSGMLVVFKSIVNPRHVFLPLWHAAICKFIDLAYCCFPPEKTFELSHFYRSIILHIGKKCNT